MPRQRVVSYYYFIIYVYLTLWISGGDKLSFAVTVELAGGGGDWIKSLIETKSEFKTQTAVNSSDP